MTKKYIHIIIFLLLILQVFFYPPKAIGDWQQRIGGEVVFIEMESSLQKYNYSLYRKPDIGPRLPYKDYVGKRGEVVGVVKQIVFSFWDIQLENGGKVYAHKLDEYDDQIDGLYFIDNYNEAKGKIGKFIWINQNKWKVKKQPLITEDENVSYPLEHLEKIKVVDVFTKMLGHSYGAKPFFLKVKKSTGEVGLIGYNPENYFDNDPIDPSWDKSIVEIIKKQKIQLGMIKDQVLISWGKPKDINRTVTLHKTEEQWVYDKQYLYFEDNKLTAYQD